jgi:glycosyltransferase involved in cell wall biosynthesis
MNNKKAIQRRTSVLHIITRLIVGGAQENTLYTSELLDNQRYEVEVLSGPQTGTEGSLIENGIERGVHIKIESNLVREIHPLKDILAFRKILKYLKKNRYQIVHTHSSKAGIIGRWAAWVAGVPTIIHTVHGWGFHDYQHSFIRFFYIFAEKLSRYITDRLIAVTLKDIEKGIRAGIGKREDYTLIRSGIDLHRFTLNDSKKALIRKEFAIPTDAKVIGTVTRLSTQKAPQVFIDSAAMILEACPDVHFVIVGDGPLRTALEKRGKALGIGHRIVFTGIRNDVHDVMQAFDLFMLTSLWEGLPRVIPQAMASGVPVIASRVDGNSEIIKNHENGVLVEPEAAKEFSKAAIDLINNETDARKLKNHALEGIDEYSVQVMVRKIDELYRSL